ncbi:MAG: hypothetical protein H0W39_11780 [Sphingomonas sp.]|nr:hypothetical protein [Sphingomonas sp.]
MAIMQFGKIELPSNRRFGLFMASVLAVLAVYLSTTGNSTETTMVAVLAALLSSIALVKPDLLSPLNRAWMALGLALGMIVSPIVLAILFFIVLTPMALLLRILGRDELRLRRSTPRESYWRLREPAGPPPSSFRRQF